MRPTKKVLETYRRYGNMNMRARYLANGKIDPIELEELFRAVLANQCHLASAIADVYQAVSRIEHKIAR